MSIDQVRIVCGVAAALGVLLALVGIPRAAPRVQAGARLGGIAVMVAAWVGLVVGLLPESATSSLERRLTTPVGGAAALVGLAVAIGVAVLVGRLVIRFPTAWFVALGVALPLRIPVPLGGETRNLLLPLYLVIAAGVVAWLWARRTGAAGADDDPRGPLDLPLALLVGFSLLSLAWSVDREEGAVKAVFFYVPFVLLYMAVMAWWPRARALRALGFSTIALAIPVALLALYQFQTRELLLNERLAQANKYSSFFRANAIFFDPNILGRFLVVAIVAVVAIAWLRRDRTRDLILAGVVLVPLCAGLAVTFSRSSCLMLMAAIALMAWWAFGARRTLLVGTVLAVVLGGAAFAASGNVRRAATDSQRLEKVSEGRFDLMRGGLEIWQEAPVHGAGLGGFEQRYTDTLSPTERRRIRVVISHNTPITVLSELGAIGFTLLCALGVAALAVIPRRARRSDTVNGWCGWTMLALLVGIFVHTLFYSALFEDPYCWVLLAGAVAATALARPRVDPPALSAPSTETT